MKTINAKLRGEKQEGNALKRRCVILITFKTGFLSRVKDFFYFDRGEKARLYPQTHILNSYSD